MHNLIFVMWAIVILLWALAGYAMYDTIKARMSIQEKTFRMFVIIMLLLIGVLTVETYDKVMTILNM